MYSPTTHSRSAPKSGPARAVGLSIAALLALLLFATTASRVLEPVIRAAPSYLLDGLIAPASLAQRTS